MSAPLKVGPWLRQRRLRARWNLKADMLVGTGLQDDIVMDRSSEAILEEVTGLVAKASNEPRLHSLYGALTETTIENKAYRNYDPADTTGWAATGGTFDVVDDSTALAAAGLSILGDNVFSLVNASGSTQYVYGGDQCGNTNKHSLSVYARLVAGAGAELGLRNASGGAFASAVAISDSYVRTKAPGVTPAAATCQIAIAVPDGCTLYFVGQQPEQSTNGTDSNHCTTVIRNSSTSASVTRNRDRFDISRDVFVLTEGELVFTLRQGWPAGTGYNDHYLLTQRSGNTSFLIMEPDTLRVILDDGTNTAAVDYTEQDEYTVNILWDADASQMALGVNGSYTTATFDGSFSAHASNPFSFGRNVLSGGNGPIYVRDLCLYRRPRWR